MSSLVLDTTDPRFKCSLDLGETECHSFRQGCRQVVFSQTCKYIGVLCERKLIVFDIEQANSSNDKDIHCKPMLTVTIKEEEEKK